MHLIVAVYANRQDAALAIGDILKEGYPKGQISVIGKDKRTLSLICQDTGLPRPRNAYGQTGLFGEFKDLLSSLQTDELMVTAVGPAAEKLAGAEIGTEADGLVVSLVGIGIPHADAEAYEQMLLRGHIIVVVECTLAQSRRMMEIVQSHHSVHIFPTSKA